MTHEQLQAQITQLSTQVDTQERTIDRKNRELLAKDRQMEGKDRHIAWLEHRLEHALGQDTERKPTAEEFAEYVFGGQS